MTALAAGTVAGGVVGAVVVGGGCVVVVVGSVPAARSSGMRADADPHAAHTTSTNTASLEEMAVEIRQPFPRDAG
jgi:hypothetical protein